MLCLAVLPGSQGGVRDRTRITLHKPHTRTQVRRVSCILPHHAYVCNRTRR